MQSASLMIGTQVAVFSSYDDNLYVKSASIYFTSNSTRNNVEQDR